MRFDRYDKLIFDLSSPGRVGARAPETTVPVDPSLAALGGLLREDLPLPEVAEPEVVRHYVALSRKNYHIDQGFYPLGSCTMKYNPKTNEDAAAMPGFAALHPLTPESHVQGALALMHGLGEYLLDLTGMEDLTMQPAAGAQGELTALMMIKAYFADVQAKSGGEARDEMLTPDSAHGTNPASAAMVGMKVREIRSNSQGRVDIDHLRELLSARTACVMITNPNTLGIFEDEILEITKLVHDHGAFVYMDGANMNALLGRARPGDMGFDVMHLNLHKTFSTPHGGGGPGAGPVLVKSALAPYLPVPRVERQGEKAFRWNWNHPNSIGKVHGQYGNYGMLVRAYTYILSFGVEGLTRISGIAVLNANYLREQLQVGFTLPYKARCMHEFVLSGTPLKEKGLRTMDVAKRLLDYGFHSPTIYFPLIVEEALMIEPTESESKETLDAFIAAMKSILREIDEDPELVHGAPHTTPVRRLDETKAARQPILKYQDVNQPAGSTPARRAGPGCPV